MVRPALVLVALVVASAPFAVAKKSKPQPCAQARYLVDPASEPLLPGASPATDAVVIDPRGHVSLDGCGPATHASVKATARFTRFTATWPQCGSFAKVSLTAKVAAPACGTMTGRIKAKKTKPKTFDAARSSCGDGRVDTAGGEECDTSADEACPGRCNAPGTTNECHCTSTTTTTIPTGPIAAPNGQWTWVDFPDSACDDGSPTGIGVNLAASPNVLVFLNGGGACWDYNTCYTLNLATHGPFGPTQFDASRAALGGTILDRQLAGNPFADWNLVFVPYCTGDVHAGDNVIAYQSGGVTKVYHHVGHANVVAYLKRLGPTFPNVGKLVVSGSSAGGFGAFSDYPNFRAQWPNGKLYLLDDSGPTLESHSYSSTLRDAWVGSWRLDKLVNAFCGAPCLADFSEVIPALGAAYPNDRFALLETEQDGVVSFFYGLNGPTFQNALLEIAAGRIDDTANFHYFFVPGTTHTMLGHPTDFSQNSTPLLTWITQLVTDDPAWTSVKP